MRIDSHHHIWDQSKHPQTWMTPDISSRIAGPFSLEDWHRDAGPHGVDSGIFVQTVMVPAETRMLLEAAAGHPHLVGVVGWLDFDPAHTLIERIAALGDGLDDNRLVGLRAQAEYHSDIAWLATTSVVEAAATLATANLTMDLLTVATMLPAACELARQAPQTRLVLNHMSKPTMREADFEAWAQGIRTLATHETVACKLSGFLTFDSSWAMDEATLRPYFDAVLEAFGPSRIMFGSDWPVSNLGGGYSAAIPLVESLISELSGSEQASIWAGTAARWYPQLVTTLPKEVRR